MSPPPATRISTYSLNGRPCTLPPPPSPLLSKTQLPLSLPLSLRPFFTTQIPFPLLRPTITLQYTPLPAPSPAPPPASRPSHHSAVAYFPSQTMILSVISRRFAHTSSGRTLGYPCRISARLTAHYHPVHPPALRDCCALRRAARPPPNLQHTASFAATPYQSPDSS